MTEQNSLNFQAAVTKIHKLLIEMQEEKLVIMAASSKIKSSIEEGDIKLAELAVNVKQTASDKFDALMKEAQAVIKGLQMSSETKIPGIQFLEKDCCWEKNWIGATGSWNQHIFCVPPKQNGHPKVLPEPAYPYWIKKRDQFHTYVIAFLPRDLQLTDYWSDAYAIVTEPKEIITLPSDLAEVIKALAKEF